MTVTWKKEFDGKTFLDNIENFREIRDDKKVRFIGFTPIINEFLLYKMLDFNNEISETQARRMIWRALVNAGSKGKINNNSFISAIKEEEENYLSQTPRRYVIAGSISISQFSKLPVIRTNNNSVIIFEKILKKGFRDEVDELRKNYFFDNKPIFGSYQNIRIFVDAKTVDDAIDKAIDDFDFVRGVWNLRENNTHSFRISGGNPKPVNSFVYGNYFTIHEKSGKLAADSIYTNPNFNQTITPISLNSKEVDDMQEYLSHIRKLLRTTKYKEKIVRMITRYANALDSSNFSIVFLELWSVLESLTGVDHTNGSYSTLKRRTAFIFEDTTYNMEVLEQLRQYRNEYVHRNIVSVEIEKFVYILKNYVERLLFFHLANGKHFTSLHETVKLLDSPTNLEEINKKIDILTFAKKFRGY